MPHCPNCKSKSVRRSRSKNQWERWRKAITHKLLYRCRNCNWRGWRAPVFSDDDEVVHDRATAPDPPNLGGTPLARTDTAVHVDLTELDRDFGQPTKDES
jgi:hypothetical protein